MFPRFFPYAPIQSTGIAPVVPLSFVNITPGSATVPNPVMPSSPALESQAADLQTQLASLLLAHQPTLPALVNPVVSSLSGLGASGLASPYLFPSILSPVSAQNPLANPFAGGHLGVDVAANYAALMQILPLVGLQQQHHHHQQQQPNPFPSSTAPKSDDTHTIVRAPVLYKTDQSQQEGANYSKLQTTGKKRSSAAENGTSASPPDRIVASYAAAARAAAIAYQQPLSSAAEVFLGATSTSQGSVSVKTRSIIGRRARASRLALDSVPAANTTTSAISTPLSRKGKHLANGLTPPTPWNSFWTRIVDRNTDVVVYISPDGHRLKSVAEIRAYMSKINPGTEVIISDECITANFCFDASKESRLLSAPDDSIFSPASSIDTATAAAAVLNVDGHMTNSTTAYGSSVEQAETRPGSICRINFNPIYPEIVKRPKLDSIENSEGQTGTPSSAANVPFSEDLDESTSPTVSSALLNRNIPTNSSSVASAIESSPISSDASVADGLKAPEISKSADDKDSVLQPNSSVNDTVTSSLSVNFSGCGTLAGQEIITPRLTGDSTAATTTPTFVARGAANSEPGPSVVSSVLPPTPRTDTNLISLAIPVTANSQQQQQNELTACDTGALFCPNSAFWAVAQIQQQRQLCNFAGLVHLQQQQHQAVSWPLLSVAAASQLEESLAGSGNNQAALLQLSAALSEHERQQQAAAAASLLMYQQQQQEQQHRLTVQTLQVAYAREMQRIQQLRNVEHPQQP
ncbi:unnamed protein product [Schistocephalus solidus]|uniref:MBD domain-containing protein n=1 Tax=Schistocephalus solidus TaxID=70667 RepID=A0A183TCC3_SCHSO|nr:unnamed protein product [Schistocephalus solidus]